MIEPLDPTKGDVRDAMEVAKINEMVRALNQPAVSSHPQLVRVDRNEGGFIFDFSGLINAIGTELGKQL